jgi:mRNA interferase RelE/StbE
MIYKTIIDISAEKDIERFPVNAIKRIVKAIDGLSTDPRPVGAKKLKGSDENLYRIRSGDYRIIYAINDGVRIVNIRRIRHRRDVYRDL